ncbi:MAG: molybdenum cofactor biosynthesis protein MoaE [Actinobacteria bacterium]|nr:molybdenum cofactor biosynthesis protein MoaE [Actinomycetota bacterium]
MAQSRSVSVELIEGTPAESVITKVLKAAGLSDGLGVAESARLAVNHEYAVVGTTVSDGDELALIPPVSGGAPAYVRVGVEPLDVAAVHKLVTTERTGTVVVLTGCARGADRLHYEAYEEMALARLWAIAEDLLRQYRLEAVAIEHRVGDLSHGEPAVIVAVSAAQHPPAFAAAREAIDRVKTEAPIWRLECDGDFRSWVRGDPSGGQLRAV